MFVTRSPGFRGFRQASPGTESYPTGRIDTSDDEGSGLLLPPALPVAS